MSRGTAAPRSPPGNAVTVAWDKQCRRYPLKPQPAHWRGFCGKPSPPPPLYPLWNLPPPPPPPHAPLKRVRSRHPLPSLAAGVPQRLPLYATRDHASEVSVGRRGALVGGVASAAMAMGGTPPAFARKEPVNRPDLLPEGPMVKVIDTTKLLTNSQLRVSVLWGHRPEQRGRGCNGMGDWGGSGWETLVGPSVRALGSCAHGPRFKSQGSQVPLNGRGE